MATTSVSTGEQSSSSSLASTSCEPCKGDSPLIPPEQYDSYLKQLSPQWHIAPFQDNSAPALQRHFTFKNFKQALRFGNTIGEIAETPGIKHHPAIVIEWGKVTCAWWTHAIGGLHKNDFICAAKTDEAAKQAQGLVPPPESKEQ